MYVFLPRVLDVAKERCQPGYSDLEGWNRVHIATPIVWSFAEILSEPGRILAGLQTPSSLSKIAMTAQEVLLAVVQS